MKLVNKSKVIRLLKSKRRKDYFDGFELNPSLFTNSHAYVD